MTATQSEALKEEGNQYYKAGEYLKAAGSYTKGLKDDPNNAILYSNRSVAFLKLNKLQKALADAEKCVELRGDWDKGYYRKGAVLEELKKSEEALECFKKAFELNPQNAEAGERVKALTRFVKKAEMHQQNTAKASSAPADGRDRITDDESYKAAIAKRGDGEAIPFDQARLDTFISDMKRGALSAFVEGEGKPLPPSVSFLPGRRDASGEEQMGQVSIKGAFDSPELNGNCLEFLRQYARDTQAQASCLVVMRDDVAYPQVWKNTKWPKVIGNTHGFFIQIQSKDGQKRLWFTPAPRGSKMPGEPVLLDPEEFVILPPIFRS